MWSSLVLLALLASAQGRAVNISNTWVLPEEGFPVFYRYFRDRISWYEADAVCQFHHANLVTVDTTAQYDAVRAYLKELDISSAVWVGLIRSNPDGDFTWTDYRGLSGDGYWSTAPDSGSAPVCAAANPSADYRWEARACGGPTVASFICELPVPQWALGSEGCMVKELPALTILYLPESAAVQLNADCGLAGVKRVQCTGNVKREGLLKDLSCADEEELSTPLPTSMSTNWPTTTDSVSEDTTNEASTEENTTTDHTVDVNQQIVNSATSLPQYIISKKIYKDNLNTAPLLKNVNLGESNDHNIESNFIPKLVDVGNVLTNDQLEKLEDERHMQHKMIHEEIARVGNVDNIFTQPTDHFIPPLVMAKSRMSDDMTVLSLAEKHAQQLAEKQFSKHNQNYNIDYERNNNKLSLDNAQMDKTLIASVKPNKVIDAKKENLKTHVPKKYVNEKYYETKGKVAKIWDLKTTESTKETTPLVLDISTSTTTKVYSNTEKASDDFGMDLTVMLKDTPFTKEIQNTDSTKYSGDIVKLETQTEKHLPAINQSLEITSMTEEIAPTNFNNLSDRSTLKHEVVKITLISNNNPAINTTVFEITTKMPIFKDDTDDDNMHSTTSLTTLKTVKNSDIISVVSTDSTPTENLKQSSSMEANTAEAVVSVIPVLINPTTTDVPSTMNIDVGTTAMPLVENKTKLVESPTTMRTTAINMSNKFTTGYTDRMTTGDNISTVKPNLITDSMNGSIENNEFNITDIHDHLENNMNETDDIADANSPLLSGAYEPIHRPARTKTPQQQNRKFNPFRILG